MQSHIRKMHAYLTVISHLHFWQNDRIFYVDAVEQLFLLELSAFLFSLGI